LSFETAVFQLGGHCGLYGPECGRIGEREAIVDLAKSRAAILRRWCCARIKTKRLSRWRATRRNPVINGLSDKQHPCQALGDLLTIREKLKRLEKVQGRVHRRLQQRLPFTGAGAGEGRRATVRPESAGLYRFTAAFVKSAGITLSTIPATRSKMPNVVCTDTWTSMASRTRRTNAARRFGRIRSTPS